MTYSEPIRELFSDKSNSYEFQKNSRKFLSPASTQVSRKWRILKSPLLGSNTLSFNDFFLGQALISHASEDKESFVAPLAQLLSNLGVKVWYDEFALKLGDSLSRSIDKGLANSKYGIVTLSKAFIKKPWPEYELRGLVSREIGRDKVILPIWHGVTRDDILEFSPPLADKLALDTSKHDMHRIALDIIEVIRPDIYQNLIRLAAWERIVSKGVVCEVSPRQLHPGTIRHEVLPEQLLVRIRLIHSVLSDVLLISLDEMIDAFRRDAHPMNEVAIWERFTVAYQEITRNKQMSYEERKEILSMLLKESTRIPRQSGA